MHPGFLSWWLKEGRGCGSRPHVAAVGVGFCEPGIGEGFRAAAEEAGGFPGGPFGVRRPLRFLAYKLDLDETQVEQLAEILDELKTERAQAAVDQRRTTSSVADLFTAAAFDEAKGSEARDAKVKSAQRLADAQARALRRLHALLNEEQRKTFAYLLRTGVIAI